MPPQDSNKCADLASMKVMLPGGDWLKHIVHLQRVFGSRFCDFECLDTAGKIDATQYYLACMSNEMEEVRDWLPWKQHKKYKDNFVNEIELKFELIDILHYFVNLCLVWGMDANEIMKMYLQKHQENIDRQNRGY